MPESLAHEPHHDGSATYLSNPHPALEESVTVTVRTPIEAVPERMWVRTTYDAEPTYAECVIARRDDQAAWWTGRVLVHSPVTHYRFLIEQGATQTWLTAAGVAEHDVDDSRDFTLDTHEPAPDWATKGVVYQIFPDRFARSAAADQREVPAWAIPAAWGDPVVFEPEDPRTPLQLFGGDLDGITDHLDHLAELGADIVYTTPVFPGESNHRYNATTFDRVDDLLGGDAAYARLSAAVHDRGWHLLGDLTTNHTGDTHEWFRDALAGGPHRDWYCFRDDGSYECWMGHGTLPKLNWTNDELRSAMVQQVIGRWLEPPIGLDGWRIDVANMTGRWGAVDVNHKVAGLVRAEVLGKRPDAVVIGEHNHDASGDLNVGGWHGTMNYSGFSWPVWSWLVDPDSRARPFGRPLPVARRGGRAVVRTIREWHARYGWEAVRASWNILGSHDSARIATLTGDARLHEVAAVLQFTLPGVPMIFAGDEVGLQGVNGEDSRRPMPWGQAEAIDHHLFTTYADLAAARRESPALTEGSLRWLHAGDDVICFVREHPEGSLLVIAARAASESFTLPIGLDAERVVETTVALTVTASEGGLLVEAAGPGAAVWRLGPERPKSVD